MNLCQLNTFWPVCCVCTANRPKSEEKSVQLAEVHLYRTYFLHNPYYFSKGEWSGAEIFKEKFNLLDRVCEAVKGLVQLYHYESQQTLYSPASSTVG